MDFRQLRSFVAVAEERHFARAAARLFVSAPALSQQIRTLERVLGAPLLVRSPRQVELTEAGAVFLVHARALLAAADRARDAVRPYGSGLAGSLTVGIIDEGAAELTVPILAAYRAGRPAVTVHVRSVGYGERSDTGLDVLLGLPAVPGAPPRPDLDTRTLFTDGRIAMVPRCHPLAAAVALDPADLLDEPQVDWPRTGADPPAYLNRFRNGEPARVAGLARSMPEMLLGVASGAGVAVVTAANERFWPHPGVVYVPLAAPDRVANTVAARRGEDRPEVLGFLAVAERVAAEVPALLALPHAATPA